MFTKKIEDMDHGLEIDLHLVSREDRGYVWMRIDSFDRSTASPFDMLVRGLHYTVTEKKMQRLMKGGSGLRESAKSLTTLDENLEVIEVFGPRSRVGVDA